MKIHCLTLFFALLTALTASAQTHEYKIKVSEFSELKVNDAVNVDYRQSADSSGLVTFTCAPDFASFLILENKGRTLNVRVATDAVGQKGLPRVTVYSRYLNSVFNSGDSTVRVLSVADCPKFEASLQNNGTIVVRDLHATEVKASLSFGHGTIILEGTCDKAEFKMKGAGDIEADGLAANEVKVNAAGTGSIGVNAVKMLNVYGLGSTTIYYKGEPEIKKKGLGIKVKPIR